MIRNTLLNTLRSRQNGRHFPDDIFKYIILNENVWIAIRISLKFVPKGRINNIPAFVHIMAWRRPGDKPLSEPKMVSLLTHFCATRSQWLKVKVFLWLCILYDLSTLAGYLSPSRIKHWPIYLAYLISWLLMTWRRKETGHHQPPYWRSDPGIFFSAMRWWTHRHVIA